MNLALQGLELKEPVINKQTYIDLFGLKLKEPFINKQTYIGLQHSVNYSKIPVYSGKGFQD